MYIGKIGRPKSQHTTKKILTKHTFCKKHTYVYLEHRIHIQTIILNKTFALYRNINHKISKKKP